MNYNDGIIKMKELKGSGSFSPYEKLTVNYPGKRGPRDYRLDVEGIAPTHPYIARTLYNKIRVNNFSFNQMNDFLIDVYDNGTDTIYRDQTLESLKHMIYWVTLQEEINFPRALGNAGINLPFCRYYEAIYCTLEGCEFELQNVLERCNNHHKGKPTLYNINNPPHYYNY